MQLSAGALGLSDANSELQPLAPLRTAITEPFTSCQAAIKNRQLAIHYAGLLNLFASTGTFNLISVNFRVRLKF